MRQKSAKMEEDIAFLTQSTHSALDQREKVKTKFLSAQRDEPRLGGPRWRGRRLVPGGGDAIEL